MSELEEAHKYSHSLALDHSSYQTGWSHISSIDHPARTRCSAFGHRHRSAGRVGDGAFAVDDGESRESVTMAVHNTFRCGEDGYSCWPSIVRGWETRVRTEAVGDSQSWTTIATRWLGMPDVLLFSSRRVV